jgi:hypothetical protein
MVVAMKFRQYIPDYAVSTIPVFAVLFAVHSFLLRDEAPDSGIELTDGAPAFYDHWQRQFDDSPLDIDSGLTRLELDDAQRDRLIRELLRQKKYQQARTQLLEVAAVAALRDDQARLGDTLMLLGEVAINQQELAAAEIYLQEALYLSMEQDNLMGTARGYQLLGRLNIRARELARRAANTHDELWQARNAMSRGYYQGVGESLQRVIENNASLHDRVHDDYLAQQARIEAAKLYASTGQMTHVQRLFDGIDRKLISDADLAAVRREINALFDEHQRDLVKTSQARDYQGLYHHYLRQGQLERAWQFRVKSSATLAETGERSMFQRQAEVIAVLYNSNFAMDRARKYLDKAGSIYDEHGVDEMVGQTREMESLIY